ncbi:MAG: ABC transporter permease [Lachnospiraceae bacterium]|nr:ABC transporter permease [Lachnospiraceae bacterium]
MKLSDLLLMSISNLWKRKLRTVLTVLGVVIGITSIVVMMALGNGLKESMMESISNYSSITQITVNSERSWNSDGKQQEEIRLDDALVQELFSMEHVVGVYPKLTVSVLAKSGKYISWMNLCGMTQEGLASLKLPVGQGELPKEGGELTLFYGSSVLTDFYIEKTGIYPYWEKQEVPDIDLMESPIFIIFDTDAYWSSKNSGSDPDTPVTKAPKKYLVKTSGVMEGEPGEWTMNSSNVYCDMEALKIQLKRVFKKNPIPGQPTRKNGKPYNELFYTELVVQVDEMENVQALTTMLQDQGYNAYSDAEWIQSQTEQMNTIQLVLGAIGAVSLLVAAIGITNTMMMSIYERTKEIGVMKVLGCDIRNIQALFLMEAGFIGFIGGIVGIIFSYGLSIVINSLLGASQVMGMTGDICRIPGWLPLLAVLFAIVIGMIAGFLPSLRAMRLSPLAAIRNE